MPIPIATMKQSEAEAQLREILPRCQTESDIRHCLGLHSNSTVRVRRDAQAIYEAEVIDPGFDIHIFAAL